MATIINIYYDPFGHLYPDYPEKYTGEFTGQYVPLAEYQRDLTNAETDKRVMMEAADTIAELRREVERLKTQIKYLEEERDMADPFEAFGLSWDEVMGDDKQ